MYYSCSNNYKSSQIPGTILINSIIENQLIVVRATVGIIKKAKMNNII